MQAAAVSEGRQRAPQLPAIDGTFTVTTDAAVLANNTDEGPVAGTAGEALVWQINPRTAQAPTALIATAP